ncbi:MAG: hypothetical protein RL758_312 [Pseudomonadota bacterium]|jgi:hypothetical protein
MNTKKAKPDLTPAPRPEVFNRPIYDGKELRRNPGITAERFRAYELPSLRGGNLIYPKEKA